MTAIGQHHLFGEPPKDEALAQFHTPDRVADEMAAIAATHYGLGQKTLTVLEPSVGGGALLGGIQRLQRTQVFPVLERVHATAVDLDAAWLAHTRKTYPWVHDGVLGDFLLWEPGLVFDLALGNPPYDGGWDTQHLKAIARHAKAFVLLLRTVALHGKERAPIWSGIHVDEIVVIDERVAFNGETGMIDVAIIAGRPHLHDPNLMGLEQFPRFRHL